MYVFFPPPLGAHAIAIMTEWGEFKTLDYQKIYDSMTKPAFVFDGRNILDTAKLTRIGFEVRWACMHGLQASNAKHNSHSLHLVDWIARCTLLASHSRALACKLI